MGLSKADVQEIIQLLDDLKAGELRLRTRHYTLTVRRDGDGWVHSVDPAGALTESSVDTDLDRGGRTDLDGDAGADVGRGTRTREPADAGADLDRGTRAGPDTGAATDTRAGSAAEPAGGAELVAVRTPMAGTFYRAPKPGAPPYVEVGSPVEAETVVGIVETMKLMNPVHAGVRGQVAEVCVNNAELAEQDAVLMRIAPAEPKD